MGFVLKNKTCLSKKVLRFIPLILLMLIIGVVWWDLGDLNSPGLSAGDEALTALRTRGISEQGHMWTPYWNGTLDLHKPPLYYWITDFLTIFLG